MDARSKILTLVPPVGRRKRLPYFACRSFDSNVGQALSPVNPAVAAPLAASHVIDEERPSAWTPEAKS